MPTRHARRKSGSASSIRRQNDAMDEREHAALAQLYLRAKCEVLGSSYACELINSPDPAELSEPIFLREFAWVVLASGMAESVVRNKFPDITRSFLFWKSAKLIAENAAACLAAGLRHFRHRAKLGAIVRCAEIVADTKFSSLRKSILADPFRTLERFPYIGPATSHHLAKNLGFNTPKPDRHLRRIAAAEGLEDVSELCQLIAVFVGDDVRKVDTVLWRYATMHADYLTRLFGSG